MPSFKKQDHSNYTSQIIFRLMTYNVNFPQKQPGKLKQIAIRVNIVGNNIVHMLRNLISTYSCEYLQCVDKEFHVNDGHPRTK